jgi:sarcosine oxidase subunit delta
MRFSCPYCGERDVEEFITRGGAYGSRPHPTAADALEAFVDYVYIRTNTAGPASEYWYHFAGCRSWLRITRDTRTHVVLKVEMATS